MKTFYIADTHFGHKNIIKYCNRPFEDALTMDATMIENWNKVVTPEDTVIHIGDFALCNFERAKGILEMLNGYKILVNGNHDGGKDYMLRLGFDKVVNYIYKDEVLIIHDPMSIYILNEMDGSATLTERHEECKYLLHGHVHEKILTKQFPKAINCCVEHLNYTPKTFEELIS